MKLMRWFAIFAFYGLHRRSISERARARMTATNFGCTIDSRALPNAFQTAVLRKPPCLPRISFAKSPGTALPTDFANLRIPSTERHLRARERRRRREPPRLRIQSIPDIFKWVLVSCVKSPFASLRDSAHLHFHHGALSFHYRTHFGLFPFRYKWAHKGLSPGTLVPSAQMATYFALAGKAR